MVTVLTTLSILISCFLFSAFVSLVLMSYTARMRVDKLRFLNMCGFCLGLICLFVLLSKILINGGAS